MANRPFPGSTQIAVAIALAGALNALAQFARPVLSATGRYSFSTSGDQIRRFDTVSGEALICNRNRCLSVDAEGARERYDNNDNWLDEELNRQ